MTLEPIDFAKMREADHSALLGYIRGAFTPRKTTNNAATAERLARFASNALDFSVTPDEMLNALIECGYYPSGTCCNGSADDGELVFALSMKRPNNTHVRYMR